MKTAHLFHIMFLFLIAGTLSAQQSLNYKAIIHDDHGDPLANSSITIQFTILENGTTSVYQESHNQNTDASGIIVVIIGEGTLISGDFNAIDWGGNPQYLKTEIDIGMGLTDMGTTEFRAVPYALHAQTAEDAATKAYVDQLVSRIELIENNIDQDYDGFTAAQGDCNDFNAEIHPGAYDICHDGIDQDCDGNDNNCTVTDYDGNVYQTVQIGMQEWMAEDLKVKHYADGTPISLVVANSAWMLLNPQGKAYCWYNNEETYGETYGALYTWAAATNGLGTFSQYGVQGVCPDGWKLPGNVEWDTLANYLEGTIWAGSKLKEEGTMHWISPNPGATNETGFTALPGGARWADGIFERLGTTAHYWTATQYSEIQSYVCHLWNYSRDMFLRDFFYKTNGLSVRCVKD